MSELGLGCIHEGVVVDRDDPEGLWRVRIQIPGLIEGNNGSNWAWPMGSFGGGSPQSGGFRVPQVGAEVGVLFIDGDPDRPVYFPAWYGVTAAGSEMPTPAKDVPVAEAKDIAVLFETPRYVAYMDERAGKELLVFKDKISGDLVEWDSTGPGITIQGTAALLLKSDGLVSIDAPVVLINGRTVLPSAKPI